MGEDPFRVLGVPSTADMGALRAARRRLAKQVHPDRGGDLAAMTAINAAFDACVAQLSTSPLTPRAEPSPSPERRSRWVSEEQSAFVVHSLPVEAFDSLVTVASLIGEIVDEDPPYGLDAYLYEPTECLCRLELLPDAGSSTVNIYLGHIEGAPWPPPSTEEVRDRWLAALNGYLIQP
jgi:hypothetical protein